LYDLTVQTTAVKGWSIADLASKSGVARSTIYGWRDNSGKPTAKAVNAIADALGIPRERALRAAGIIASASPEPPPGISDDLTAAINEDPELTDAERQAVLAAVKRQIAIERGWAAGASAAAAEPGRRQPAS
jgi:transcriptional regulator with XRE-family HTH domain